MLELLPEAAAPAVVAEPDADVVAALGVLELPLLPHAAIAKAAAIGITNATSRFILYLLLTEINVAFGRNHQRRPAAFSTNRPTRKIPRNATVAISAHCEAVIPGGS